MPTTTRRPARLALADGSVFRGFAFGADAEQVGETVFNTAMTGYQEALTDPSYAGQLLTFTQPMIGNTGVNTEDMESAGVRAAGVIVRELSRRRSNYRAEESLEDLLERAGVPGISGIDTRALTRKLRSAGVLNGVISADGSRSDAELVERARSAPSMKGQNLVPRVGCEEESDWNASLGAWGENSDDAGQRASVLALDCGAKSNILRHLVSRGIRVRVAPHDTPGADISDRFRAGEIQGLFISNGPGDPDAVEATVSTLRGVLEAEPEMPVFGICLGHQMLALALGARTFKMSFGHRGANQPVLDLETGRVEITSQNHGFAVDPDSLPDGFIATHRHLNDGTLAGFRASDRPVAGVQHHPEASPGPHDSAYLFERFCEQVRAVKAAASRSQV